MDCRRNLGEKRQAEVIFVDTSALYALLDKRDPSHRKAADKWKTLQTHDDFVTTNYVVLEAVSLLQSRLGTDAVKTLHDLLLVVKVHFLDRAVHDAAIELLFAESRRHLSLVDCSSFVFMRRAGIHRALAIDDDFKRAGFELL